MVTRVRVIIPAGDLATMQDIRKRLGLRLPRTLVEATKQYSGMVRDEVRSQFIKQKKVAGRSRTARKFRSKRLSKLVYGLYLPPSAYNLDTMKPHYVALRRGRKITRWARKYYVGSNPTTFAKGRRSQVFKGPRGGIIHQEGRKSQLYVSPDPFVKKAVNRVSKMMEDTYSKRIRHTLKGGK